MFAYCYLLGPKLPRLRDEPNEPPPNEPPLRALLPDSRFPSKLPRLFEKLPRSPEARGVNEGLGVELFLSLLKRLLLKEPRSIGPEWVTVVRVLL